MKHVCRQQRVVRMNLFMSTLVQLYVLHHSNKHLQKRAQSPITCTFCKVEHQSERSLFVTDPVPRKEFLKNHKSYFCCLKGTLMQIWKSANIFFFKWKYVEDFTLKYLLRFEICAREICEKFVRKHSETIEHVEN